MNTATLDFRQVEHRSHEQGRVLLGSSAAADRKAKERDEAYWSERAGKLLEIFDDEKRPVVSGSFGSFLL